MWWADNLEHLLLFDPYHASQRDALQALLDATFSQNPQLQSAARRRIGYSRACWFYLSLDKNDQGQFHGFGLMSFPCFVTDSSQYERGRLLPHNSRLPKLDSRQWSRCNFIIERGEI
jgi:hypothetical protein